MKTRFPQVLLFVATLVLAVLPAAAQTQVIRGGQCEDTNNTFGDSDTWHAVETRTIPRGSFSTLAITAARNGGVQVEGWDGADVSVTVCKFAGADDEASARRKLDAIRVNISGGQISADVPESQASVHFYVRVPANITLSLEAHNGPLGLKNVTGTVQARTVNGPLSIRHCSGTITAEARNGPVDLADTSGKVNVSAENGPVSVRLADLQWQGEGLQASTHNGPLDLRIPTRYQSGVEVVSDGHSPFRCDVCNEANRTWDNAGMKKVRLGNAGAPIVVRLSTHNGPVSVRNAMD